MNGKNRRNEIRIIFFCILFLMVVTVIICIRLSEADVMDSVHFVCETDEGVSESIYLYRDEDDWYLFLPGYADTGSMQIEYNSGYSLFLDGMSYPAGADCSAIKAGTSYELSLKNYFGREVSGGKLTIMQGGNIPALSVHLTDTTIDKINSAKEISGTGYFSLITGDGTVDYYGEVKSLHGRGNSTWGQPKKSYTLELTVPVDLLGMGSGEGWILLSNSFDESGLKNKLVYDFAEEMGIEYAVSSEFVDLYIDGEYYGEYLLTEKIDVGENRVDITDLETATKEANSMPLSNYGLNEWTQSGNIRRGYDITNDPDDITGGYLFQIEHHPDRIEYKESLFQTDLLSFSVDSPKYASTAQITYLSECVQNCENAIVSGNLSMIDEESFAEVYLLQELFANNDNSSVYLYKESDSVDSGIHMCSPWDFDLSIGNAWMVHDVNPEALYRDDDNWFDILTENDSFKGLLADRFESLLEDGLQERIKEKLVEYVSLTEQSFDMNRVRWRGVPSENNWAEESQRHYDDLNLQVSDMLDFMDARIEFLRSVWLEGVEYEKVNFASELSISLYDKTYSVLPGETLGVSIEDPVPLDGVNAVFLGWYDEDGNAFDPALAVTEDKAYEAKWELITADNSLFGKIEKLIVKHKKKLTDYGGAAFIFLLVSAFFLKDMIREYRSKRKKL